MTFVRVRIGPSGMSAFHPHLQHGSATRTLVRCVTAFCSAVVLIAGGVGAGSLAACALCWVNSPTDLRASALLILGTTAVAGCSWLLLDLSLWLEFEAHLQGRPQLDLSRLCEMPPSRHGPHTSRAR